MKDRFIDRHFNVMMWILFSLFVILLSLNLWVANLRNEVRRQQLDDLRKTMETQSRKP